MSLIIAHAGVLGESGGPNFDLRLHLNPYIVHESSEVSGKPVHMHRLAWAFTAPPCDNYQNFEH